MIMPSVIACFRFAFFLLLVIGPSRGVAQSYTPSNLTLPFFTEKGEMEVKLGFHYQPELHLSYALSDHISASVMASYGSWNRSSSPILDPNDGITQIGTYNFHSSRRTYQAAIGYHRPGKKRLVFETFAGLCYGHGNSGNGYTYTNGQESSMNSFTNVSPFFQAFIQPGIGYHGNKFGWGVGWKNSLLAFEDRPGTGVVLEPITQVGFGGEKFRVEGQFGIRLIGGSLSNFNYRYVHGGICLSYRIKPM